MKLLLVIPFCCIATAALAQTPAHQYCHEWQGFAAGKTAYTECVALYNRGAFRLHMASEEEKKKSSFMDDLYENQRQEAIDNLTPGRQNCRVLGDQVFCRTTQ